MVNTGIPFSNICVLFFWNKKLHYNRAGQQFFNVPCKRVTYYLQKRKHHKSLWLSRTKRAFDVPDIIIRSNKIDFVESASNLGDIFNGWLTWSNHINVIVGKVHGMLRNLWPVIDSTPFTKRMELAKTFLIPVLLYRSEIFGNCNNNDRRKLNLAYNIIARYVFIKGRRDHISEFSYRIFEINFDNLLNIKCLILLPKIIFHIPKKRYLADPIQQTCVPT